MDHPVSPELLSRLPRTFVPALNEQTKNWDLLFPAERRTISAQMDWLGRLPPREFHNLFEPINALEGRMALPAWNPSTPRVSIDDTGVLVRSPLYPQWRAAVGKVFETIDGGVKTGNALPARNRLIVCTMPSGVPPRTGPVWPALEEKGKWVSSRGRSLICCRRSTVASPRAKHRPISNPLSAPGCLNTTRCSPARQPLRQPRCPSTSWVHCVVNFWRASTPSTKTCEPWITLMRICAASTCAPRCGRLSRQKWPSLFATFFSAATGRFCSVIRSFSGARRKRYAACSPRLCFAVSA